MEVVIEPSIPLSDSNIRQHQIRMCIIQRFRRATTDSNGTITCKLHPVQGADPRILRIAVCGKATDAVIQDYANMDVWDWKINGKTIPLTT